VGARKINLLVKPIYFQSFFVSPFPNPNLARKGRPRNDSRIWCSDKTACASESWPKDQLQLVYAGCGAGAAYNVKIQYSHTLIRQVTQAMALYIDSLFSRRCAGRLRGRKSVHIDMATKTADDAKTRQRVIDDLGIRFRPDVDPEKWPESHRTTFGHIQTLGQTLYKTWMTEVCANWQDAPWKTDTRERAHKLHLRARDCRDRRVKEREWRSHLEPSIFQRLEDDVSW
jgi:hypothetical protein